MGNPINNPSLCLFTEIPTLNQLMVQLHWAACLCVDWPQISILLRHESCRILISILRIQQPSPLVLDVHTDGGDVSWCWVAVTFYMDHKLPHKPANAQPHEDGVRTLQHHRYPRSNHRTSRLLQSDQFAHISEGGFASSTGGQVALSTDQSADHRDCLLFPVFKIKVFM